MHWGSGVNCSISSYRSGYFGTMFSGVLSDITGGADVCECIPRHEFSNHPNVVMFSTPNEIPFIYLKAKKEEFIFTDCALVVVMGNSGASTKRMITRFPWEKYDINNVAFETAGFSFSDGDCELKFSIGGNDFSIDIQKEAVSTAAKYYQVMVELEYQQDYNRSMYNKLRDPNNYPKMYNDIRLNVSNDSSINSTVNALTASAIDWIKAATTTYQPRSYKDIFESVLGTS